MHGVDDNIFSWTNVKGRQLLQKANERMEEKYVDLCQWRHWGAGGGADRPG